MFNRHGADEEAKLLASLNHANIAARFEQEARAPVAVALEDLGAAGMGEV